MDAPAPIAAETAPRHPRRPDAAPAGAGVHGDGRPVPPVQPAERAQSRMDDHPAAPTQRASSARLSYDQLEQRVYVEIVDPDTGDILQRLPPESMSERMGFDGARPGLIVDRLV